MNRYILFAASTLYLACGEDPAATESNSYPPSTGGMTETGPSTTPATSESTAPTTDATALETSSGTSTSTDTQETTSCVTDCSTDTTGGPMQVCGNGIIEEDEIVDLPGCDLDCFTDTLTLEACKVKAEGSTCKMQCMPLEMDGETTGGTETTGSTDSDSTGGAWTPDYSCTGCSVKAECGDGSFNNSDECEICPAEQDARCVMMGSLAENVEPGGGEMALSPSTCYYLAGEGGKDKCKLSKCGDGIVNKGEECDGEVNCHECQLDRRVFVTGKKYCGNLQEEMAGICPMGQNQMGVLAADAICSTLAGAPGKFKAWLSAGQISPSTRFKAADALTKFNGHYVLLDGTVVVMGGWDDLISPTSLVKITKTEDPQGVTVDGFVWTNTNYDGTPLEPDLDKYCSTWNSVGFTLTGRVGRVAADAPGEWTKYGGTTQVCGVNPSRLYCFEDF